MAKKGQKFNKISLETKLEICKKHFEEYIPETPLAREYNLPTLVNVKGATTKLKNGDHIHIDGTKGTVTIIH